jgi:hypothetical protein
VRLASSLGLVALALVTAGATSGSRPAPVTCGPLSKLGPSGRPEVGRLLFGFYTNGENRTARARSVFDAGYPTKVLLWTKRHRPVTTPFVVRGWSCSDGKRLRFWYRRSGVPFAHLPVTQQELERTGDLAPALSNRGYGEFRGYMLFSHAGRWKISVWQRRRLLGKVVVQVGG